MTTIKIGYDKNLGLPNDFAETVGCDVVASQNIGELIREFQQQKLSALFIPAGTLPYLKESNILSQALFAPENIITLQTIFVTTKNLSINEIVKSPLGRVNQYCTTSFWAPLIHLMKVLPKGTALKFQDTNGFQDMLNKTAKGSITSCMIWDIFLQNDKTAQHQVHELFRKSDLPTPVIVGSKTLPKEIIQKINHFTTADRQAFFTSFEPPNLVALNQFKLDMKKAAAFFNMPVTETAVI